MNESNQDKRKTRRTEKKRTKVAAKSKDLGNDSDDSSDSNKKMPASSKFMCYYYMNLFEIFNLLHHIVNCFSVSIVISCKGYQQYQKSK